jgi:hypothetical protein
MDLADPAIASPSKRKRDLQATPTKGLPSLLNTDVSQNTLTAEDGACGSPRTSVAYHFQGLELESAPITKLDLKGSSHFGVTVTDQNTTRKRIKFVEDEELEIPETPQGALSDGAGEASIQRFEGTLQVNNDASPVIFRGLGPHTKSSAAKLSKSYPSINRLADSKSRARKRMGTPPLSSSRDNSPLRTEDVFVDPDRAALTWHEDEITGHDPNDPEDDGEGINGIGFQPTPAEARARMERRRQQMAEYKTREMREARAKRSERRKGGASVSSNSSKEEAARKVRFSEAEVNIMITT